jgi:hypothetical protein
MIPEKTRRPAVANSPNEISTGRSLPSRVRMDRRNPVQGTFR